MTDTLTLATDAELSALTVDDVRRMVREMARTEKYHIEQAAISTFKAERAEFDEARKYHTDQASSHDTRAQDAKVIATILYSFLAHHEPAAARLASFRRIGL